MTPNSKLSILSGKRWDIPLPPTHIVIKLELFAGVFKFSALPVCHSGGDMDSKWQSSRTHE